jgi:hypothetical protein
MGRPTVCGSGGKVGHFDGPAQTPAADVEVQQPLPCDDSSLALFDLQGVHHLAVLCGRAEKAPLCHHRSCHTGSAGSNPPVQHFLGAKYPRYIGDEDIVLQGVNGGRTLNPTWVCSGERQFRHTVPTQSAHMAIVGSCRPGCFSLMLGECGFLVGKLAKLDDLRGSYLSDHTNVHRH